MSHRNRRLQNQRQVRENAWITYVFLNYYHLTVTFETPAGSGTVVRSKLFDTPFPIPNTEEESEKEAGSDSEGLEELPESPRPGTSGAQQQLSEMEQAFADSQGRIKKKIYKPSVLEQVKKKYSCNTQLLLKKYSFSDCTNPSYQKKDFHTLQPWTSWIQDKSS